MPRSVPNPVVHLELRTGNLACACAFYTELFGWRPERIHAPSGDYTALTWGDGIQGGIVEHEAHRAYWLPYVEVADIAEVAAAAELLGASTLLPAREGPAGWRSVLAAPHAGMVALWEPKR